MAKVGRKQKTLKDLNLPKNWKDQVLKFTSQGLSKEEIYLRYFRINPQLFEALCQRDIEFSLTIKKAEILCKGWWIEQSRKSLKRKNYQSALWFMNMKNRFGWKDKTDIEHSLADSTIEKFATLSAAELIAKANAIIGKPTSPK
jgi:hypothetical protein